jgi:hypothetical protein
MKYLTDPIDLGAETGADAAPSRAVLEARLITLQERLEAIAAHDPIGRAQLQLEQSRCLIELERRPQAWQLSRAAFDVLAERQHWQDAVEACDVLFRCEQEQSLVALGNGVWLAVTFPIDAELSVAMLQHIVETTPTDSDGAAVAAAAAAYIVELRCNGRQYDDLSFYTQQMLGSVARRHSAIDGQQAFAAWMQRLELDQPDKMLVRLRNIVDVLVQDDWWIDRAAIHDSLPVQ